MKIRKPLHDNWKTPQVLLNLIEMEFGKFFDPCPLNSDFDGLNIPWKEVNYINPPYSRKLKEAFIRKAYEESKLGKTCVMLLPVSTSTKIFHEIIYPNAEIRFIRGRVKFEGINTKGELVSNKCGMHDSMFCVFRGGGVSSHYPKHETNIQEIKFKCPRKDCVGTLIENIYNFYCHCCQSTYLKSEVGKEENG